jgi:hypothetical protein
MSSASMNGSARSSPARTGSRKKLSSKFWAMKAERTMVQSAPDCRRACSPRRAPVLPSRPAPASAAVGCHRDLATARPCGGGAPLPADGRRLLLPVGAERPWGLTLDPMPGYLRLARRPPGSPDRPGAGPDPPGPHPPLDGGLPGQRAGHVPVGLCRPLHPAGRPAGHAVPDPVAHAGGPARAGDRGRHRGRAGHAARLPVRGGVRPRPPPARPDGEGHSARGTTRVGTDAWRTRADETVPSRTRRTGP